jgi:hypothetical protein
MIVNTDPALRRICRVCQQEFRLVYAKINATCCCGDHQRLYSNRTAAGRARQRARRKLAQGDTP